MTDKVRWGVLGCAAIAVRKVIPAMQGGEGSEVVALASRDPAKAKETAARLGIPKAYGSYEALLADPAIEAVYIPLPNHLHVPWSIKAAEAGKHVLCEKPIALDAAEARKLLEARDRTGVKMQEAFMVRTHPQWLKAVEIVRSGRIGTLRSVFGFFSYFNRNPANVRHRPEWGGGALLDIGCYPVTASRWMFGEEPRRVLGLVENDPDFQVDRLSSAILDFPSGQSVFTCGTQLVGHQRMEFLGEKGRVEIEVPFNAPNDRPCRVHVDDGSLLARRMSGGPEEGSGRETIQIPPCDQYRIQGDLFSRAVREHREAPVPLEDAVRNMAVLDALFRSARSGRWESPVA
jgi:predicted dehydrogenase